jgi:dTDP-4-dehydrorhamnose reductase
MIPVLGMTSRAISLEAELCGLKTPSYGKCITTAGYPTPAVRSIFSVLDCTSIDRFFGITRMELNLQLIG